LVQVTRVAGANNRQFTLTAFEKGSLISGNRVFTFECFSTSQRNYCVETLEAWVRYVFHASQIVCLDTGTMSQIHYLSEQVVAIAKSQVLNLPVEDSPEGDLSPAELEWVQSRIRGVLREAFNRMDANGDGILSLEEITKAMLLSPTKQRSPEQGRAEAAQFIEQLDKDNNKVV